MNPALMMLMRARAAASPGVSDTFTRADSTTTLGNTETGQAWTANVGTWGIISNAAYNVNPTASIHAATVGFGSVDMAVTATISGANEAGRYFGVVAAFVDVSNMYFLQSDGVESWNLNVRIAGTTTRLWTSGFTLPDSATMKLTIVQGVSAATWTVYKDGTQVATGTTALAGRPQGTRGGIWNYGDAATRLDNFKIEAP